MYYSTISFAYFEVFFLKIPTVKSFSLGGGGVFPPKGGVLGRILPIHRKVMYGLTIATINKYFEFQNDRLKIIRIT